MTLCGKISRQSRDYKVAFDLAKIRINKTNCVTFTSNFFWVKNGDRPTKYCFNLEKINCKKEIISELELDKENTFPDFDLFGQSVETPQLPNDERDKLEGPQSYDEFKQILNSYSNGKLPGKEGLTIEFCKPFFDII